MSTTLWPRLPRVGAILVGVTAPGLCAQLPADYDRDRDGWHAADPAIVAWATLATRYNPGPEVNPEFRDATQALGPAESPGGSVFNIISLGRGGSIELGFDAPIRNGEGPDFLVFENSIIDGFLELAWVEVSSNGQFFVRLPHASRIPGPVGAFANIMDNREFDGLAGAFPLGYGTPFDLESVRGVPGLDVERVIAVRVVDIVGDGSATDPAGNIIYDPFPTVGSAGFDLDAVGVIHQGEPLPPVEVTIHPAAAPGNWELRWTGEASAAYVIWQTQDFANWQTIGIPLGVDGENVFIIPPEHDEVPAFYVIEPRP